MGRKKKQTTEALTVKVTRSKKIRNRMKSVIQASLGILERSAITAKQLAQQVTQKMEYQAQCQINQSNIQRRIYDAVLILKSLKILTMKDKKIYISTCFQKIRRVPTLIEMIELRRKRLKIVRRKQQAMLKLRRSLKYLILRNKKAQRNSDDSKQGRCYEEGKQVKQGKQGKQGKQVKQGKQDEQSGQGKQGKQGEQCEQGKQGQTQQLIGTEQSQGDDMIPIKNMFIIQVNGNDLDLVQGIVNPSIKDRMQHHKQISGAVNFISNLQFIRYLYKCNKSNRSSAVH